MVGNRLPVPRMASGRVPDTVFSMPDSHFASIPPGEPAWDITFTRLTRNWGPPLEACVLGLSSRFQAIGLTCEAQVRQTPRGLSTFLALVGQRGLICIVDMTLVDGMAVGQGPFAALDIRLLNACGDVVADGLASGVLGSVSLAPSAIESLSSENLDRAATAVYVATLAQFDLLRPAAHFARCG